MRHTIGALVTGVQTCALPICGALQFNQKITSKLLRSSRYGWRWCCSATRAVRECKLFLQSRLSSMVPGYRHRAACQEPLMTDSLTSLSDLLEISRDGVDFFEQASQSVDDTRLRALFSQLAKTKASLAENLSVEVTAKPGRKSKANGPVAECHKPYEIGKA